MNLPASSRTPHAQRGAASVVIAMLLMVILAAAITAGLTITASSVRDSAINEEQTAALFLAESGLERGMNILNTAIVAGAISNSTCSNIAAAGPLNLGRGSFNYVSAISNPAVCSGAGCQSCSIVVTGTIGSASRTIRHSVKLATAFGVTGFGGCPGCTPSKPAVKMQLVNPYDVPAAAIFSLAFRRQIPSVNTKVVATACDGCTPEWNVESSNGNPSAGNLAVYKPVAALAATTLVSQTLDQNSDYAEVGGVFPSTSSTAPGITGSYWNDTTGGGAGSKTVGPTGTTTGETNSGVASTTPDPDCIAANAAVTGTQQSPSCNSWCIGADTLVFTVAGRSTVISDELTNVKFNTSGSLPQNINMTRLVHFPNTDGTTPLNSPYGPDIYSEIWYAYNPNYLSSYPVSSAGATSYPNEVKGSIGATVIASFSKNGPQARTKMTVSSVTQGKLSIGDNIAPGDGKLDSTVTITAVPSPGPTGVYTFSGDVYTGSSNDYGPISLAIQSHKLITSGSTIPLSTGNINGAGVAAGTTYVSGPDGSGNYIVNPAQTVATTIFTQGSSGTTITVPSGSPVPTTGTIIAVYSGNGNFAGGTTVLATPTANSFTVAAVATPITDAIICGGTCAFFNVPSSTTSTTQFTITKTAGTDQWAGGFTCLSGVDRVKIFTVTDSSISPGTWQEVVR